MIEKAKLGNDGPPVGRLGYGAMVLEGYYGDSDDDTAVKTLVHAIDSGMMIDSADAYGNGHNELLVAKAVKNSTNDAFIATKFGIVFDENETSTEVPTGWGFSLNINGTPRYAHKALNASLKRLEVETIDLWYVHYLDPQTPVEETVGAMAEAVQAGKVRYLGLSNVTADEVRRAHAIHPISAVQYEFSLWRREVESELLPTLRELGIALVAWSPLGSGFLTGTVDRLNENDFRQNNPRFAGDNLIANRERFSQLMNLAEKFNISPAQLALAWLLHQGQDIFPIPGTRKAQRIDENAKALSVQLDAITLQRINEIARPGLAEGATLV
ncbi:MAG: aldo/keto reductase [Desulfobacterales bacterium]|jgi:aryl-alcohol dehydrogenase-like predicted oxidoreductase